MNDADRHKLEMIQKQLRLSADNIVSIKQKVMELPLGTFQKWVGCEILQKKLWKLLALLELKLKAASQFIRSKIDSFDLSNQCLSRIKQYIKHMEFKNLAILAISTAIFVITGGILALEFVALTATLSTTALQTLQWACGISGLFGGLIILGDCAFSYYRAVKNKTQLAEAIELCQKALQTINDETKILVKQLEYSKALVGMLKKKAMQHNSNKQQCTKKLNEQNSKTNPDTLKMKQIKERLITSQNQELVIFFLNQKILKALNESNEHIQELEKKLQFKSLKLNCSMLTGRLTSLKKQQYEAVMTEFFIDTSKITFTYQNKVVDIETLREVKMLKNQNIELVLEGNKKKIVKSNEEGLKWMEKVSLNIKAMIEEQFLCLARKWNITQIEELDTIKEAFNCGDDSLVENIFVPRKWKEFKMELSAIMKK